MVKKIFVVVLKGKHFQLTAKLYRHGIEFESILTAQKAVELKFKSVRHLGTKGMDRTRVERVTYTQLVQMSAQTFCINFS